MNVEEQIRIRLAALDPSFIDLKDESYKHKNHKGRFNTELSATHFKLTIISSHFKNLSLLKRHSIIYALIKDLMNNPIHALSIDARTDTRAK